MTMSKNLVATTVLTAVALLQLAQAATPTAQTADKPTMSEAANAQTQATPAGKGSMTTAPANGKQPMAEATNDQTAATPAAKASGARRRHKTPHVPMARAANEPASASR